MTTYLTETALSVAGLTYYIQEILEGDRNLQQVWVIGEVSSLKDHPKGLFFSLCDPVEEAAIQCVVWNSQRPKLVQYPQWGGQVLVLGSLRLYPKRGEYRLIVYQVLDAGEGLQALRYQQLRSRLAQEGLFDATRKRPLPPHPQTIAVVTSSSAAAWGDIQRTLEQRYPGLYVLLSPATVQGTEAPESIVAAIERVNRDGRAEVLILARGGGAVEDLSCFNDERVVRAIAQSQIPVVTGIGHQQDESLADLVADVSAHTPTAAAEIAIPQYTRILAQYEQKVNQLIGIVETRLKREGQNLETIKSRLQRIPDTSRKLLQATARCQLLTEKLIALDPKAVLERGYAVVRREDDKIVRETEDLSLGQELVIQLHQGIIEVKVTKIMNYEL
jgi:exodeoxyribonuclease VII large subunit